MKRWKPDFDQKYYYITDGGFLDYDYWKDTLKNNWHYLTNNIFETAREAEEYQKKIEIQCRYKKYIEEHSEELDWENYKQDKFYLCYDYFYKYITSYGQRACKDSFQIYASDDQILQDAIAEIGEDNIKKYVLEVKE